MQPDRPALTLFCGLLLIAFTSLCCGAEAHPPSLQLHQQQQPASRHLLGKRAGVKATIAQDKTKYTQRRRLRQVLGLSFLFYEAQRSGRLPGGNRIPWRSHAHVDDPVPGGWYDAGDTLKISYPMSTAVSFLAWGMLDFAKAYTTAGQMSNALSNLKWATDYLVACHRSDYEFVGQVGNVNIDHNVWCRPENMTGPRPAYVWKRGDAAADLLGAASAALSSSSMVFKAQGNASYASTLLQHAVQLYNWAAESPAGFYHTLYPDALAYESGRYHDKLVYAAAWLYRATGNSSYLSQAYSYWTASDEHPWQNIYPGYDATWAPAANLLLSFAAKNVAVPGRADYDTWWKQQFLASWTSANGAWGITKTPKGLVIIGDGSWASLGSAMDVAFQMLVHAQYTTVAATKTSCINWARGQVNYALGGGGRSYVVGYGTNPPTHAHHRGASCPAQFSKVCDWSAYSATTSNPNVIKGALVGGPSKGDYYKDVRSDYQRNEVAVDYNAGFTSALAGLLVLL